MRSVRSTFPSLSASLFPFAFSRRTSNWHLCTGARKFLWHFFYFFYFLPPNLLSAVLGGRYGVTFTERRLYGGSLDTRTTGLTGHRVWDDPFCNSSTPCPNVVYRLCQILAKCWWYLSIVNRFVATSYKSGKDLTLLNLAPARDKYSPGMLDITIQFILTQNIVTRWNHNNYHDKASFMSVISNHSLSGFSQSTVQRYAVVG